MGRHAPRSRRLSAERAASVGRHEAELPVHAFRDHFRRHRLRRLPHELAEPAQHRPLEHAPRDPVGGAVRDALAERPDREARALECPGRERIEDRRCARSVERAPDRVRPYNPAHDHVRSERARQLRDRARAPGFVPEDPRLLAIEQRSARQRLGGQTRAEVTFGHRAEVGRSPELAVGRRFAPTPLARGHRLGGVAQAPGDHARHHVQPTCHALYACPSGGQLTLRGNAGRGACNCVTASPPNRHTRASGATELTTDSRVTNTGPPARASPRGGSFRRRA
jgi:hypothetical protein